MSLSFYIKMQWQNKIMNDHEWTKSIFSLLIKFISKPIDDINLLCLALGKSISLSIIFLIEKLKIVKKDELPTFFGHLFWGLEIASEHK